LSLCRGLRVLFFCAQLKPAIPCRFLLSELPVEYVVCDAQEFDEWRGATGLETRRRLSSASAANSINVINDVSVELPAVIYNNRYQLRMPAVELMNELIV
jgi:hypothetical protein